MKLIRVWLCLLGMALAVPAIGAGEEGSPPRVPAQTILQRTDVPGTVYEMILMRVELPPAFAIERHLHPGPQASQVLRGSLAYKFDGREPDYRKAGESIEIPGYAIHGATTGPSGAVLLNTFIVEKGKPLSIPADKRQP